MAVLILEILGTRVISPYYGSSVHVWSALITVTLASLAAGYLFGGFLADKRPYGALYFAEVLVSGVFALLIPSLRIPVLSSTSPLGLGAGSLVSAALLFAPALVAMSDTGPLAIRLVTSEFPLLGRGVGKVYALSTAGGVIGALLTGFVVVPFFSVRQVIFALGLALLLLGGSGLLFVSRRRGSGTVACLVALALAPSLLKAPTVVVSQVLMNRNSFYGEIRVVDVQDNRYLFIDGIVHGYIDRVTRESPAPWLESVSKPRPRD